MNKATNDNTLGRRNKTTDMKEESVSDTQEVKQQETLLKSSFFTNLLKKSMKSIMKTFITASKDLPADDVKKRVKRKTIIDPTSNWAGRQRVLANVRPLFPSSRRLKIRSVTIHRYTNEAMPSIEQYFLGKDFNVDENGNVAGEAGKYRGIMRLMRQSFSTDMDNTASESTKKTRSVSNQKENNRRQKLRREKNVFTAPWDRRKRQSDAKYRYGNTGKWHESSSSSESDVHDMGFVTETNKKVRSSI